MNKIVTKFLKQKGWAEIDDPEEQIEQLGVSPTNVTYLIRLNEIYGETRHVFRINLESAMGLADPSGYEFSVLQALRRSGVTPRPYYVDGGDKVTLGNGAMLMEYLPGRQLRYVDDYRLAARTLAAIHAQPAEGLVVSENPLRDAARQCDEGVAKVRESGSGIMVSGMKKCVEELDWLAGKVERWESEDPLVIVHGAPAANDFVVDEDGERAWLVDWETAMISNRYYDLGRFMLMASYAGETGFCRDESEKRLFLEAYAEAAGMDVPVDEMLERADIFARAAELWNSSWNCAALAG